MTGEFRSRKSKTLRRHIVIERTVRYDGTNIPHCGLADGFSYEFGGLKMFKDDTTRPPIEEDNPIAEPEYRGTRTWVLLVFGLLMLIPTAWFVSGQRIVPFTGVAVGGLMRSDVTVLKLLVQPGDLLNADTSLMVVKTKDGEELPYRSPVDHAEIAAVHVQTNDTLQQEQPILTIRDPYGRDAFGYRLLMAGSVWLISLPLSVLALLLLATGLDLDFSDFRVAVHRTIAFLGWVVASSMVLWFNRVPIVVMGDLGDVGILIWLAIVIVLLTIQLWVFSVLFQLEWFETVVGTLTVLCVTAVVWKFVDEGTAWLQTEVTSRETVTSVDQNELGGVQECPENILEGFDFGLFPIADLSGSAPQHLPGCGQLAGQGLT